MKCSEETKLKISIANKGRKRSIETRLLMSRLAKGKKKPLRSPLHKQRIGEAHRGKTIPPEMRAHLSKINTGKIIPNEIRLKISIAMRGNKSHLWRGGVTELYRMVRTCFEYKEWVKGVFKLQNWTCQKCGARGVKIHSHHKKSFKEIIREYSVTTLEEARACIALWDISNGETLCVPCHKLTPNYGGKGHE